MNTEVHLSGSVPQAVFKARVLLALYWLALAVGSHWPRLVLVRQQEADAIIQVDKTLHVLAYAGLVWLLLRARIAGRDASDAWTCCVAAVSAVLYAGVDEWTQRWALREVTPSDLAASVIGAMSMVLIACAGYQGRWTRWPARVIWFLAGGVILWLAIPQSGTARIHWLLAQFTATWGGIDKPCHFFSAIGMTWLLALACPAGAARPRLSAAVTILVMGLSAPMIEWAQSFSGRGVETADVFAHELGMLAAMLTWAPISLTRALYQQGFTRKPT